MAIRANPLCRIYNDKNFCKDENMSLENYRKIQKK